MTAVTILRGSALVTFPLPLLSPNMSFKAMPPWSSAKTKVIHLETSLVPWVFIANQNNRCSSGMTRLWCKTAISFLIDSDCPLWWTLSPSPVINWRISVQRLRTLQEKKEAQAKSARRDIATLLEAKKVEKARIKVENSELLVWSLWRLSIPTWTDVRLIPSSY